MSVVVVVGVDMGVDDYVVGVCVVVGFVVVGCVCTA